MSLRGFWRQATIEVRVCCPYSFYTLYACGSQRRRQAAWLYRKLEDRHTTIHFHYVLDTPEIAYMILTTRRVGESVSVLHLQSIDYCEGKAMSDLGREQFWVQIAA